MLSNYPRVEVRGVVEGDGEDVLNLVLAKGYLQKLLDNAHVADFLSRHQPDILREFRTIVDTVSLEG